MPSVVPLRNPLAQNAVDFNNQPLTNAGKFFKYKDSGIYLNNATSHTAGINDINSIITCAANDYPPNLATLNLGALTLANGVNINPGAAIILYTATAPGSPTNPTNIKILNTSGSVLSESSKNYTMSAAAGAAKLTLLDKANNGWLLSGNIGALVQYTFTNCCGNSESFYQINSDVSGVITSVNTSEYFFDGSDNTKPYNGIYYDSTSWIKVTNGQTVETSACDTFDYPTAYTFYTVLNDSYSEVVGYSVNGLNGNAPQGLLGFRFFDAPIYIAYSCNTSASIADGTYYTVNGYYSLEFYKGYVISYTSI